MEEEIPKRLKDVFNAKTKEHSKYIFLDEDDKSYIIQSDKIDPDVQMYLDDNLGYIPPNLSRVISEKTGRIINIKYFSHDKEKKIEKTEESELVANHLDDLVIGLNILS